ncbi:hypothetical protein [Rhizobium cremeum]|uniref:hypothetical protein n=1 Tax=Rhizobium cremeum TaxID=2813827 RepID=UPI0039E06B97
MTQPSISNLKKRAKALGIRFAKSPSPNITSENLGEFRVIDIAGNYVIRGSRFDCSLDEVAALVAEMEAA